MVVDPSADRARYKQLADLVRAQIQTGQFAPGQRLPAQNDYMQEHGLSRDTVDRAMNVLRGEGLIITDRSGSHVRPQTTRTTVTLHRGTVSARMPTAPERKKHRIDEGVPILIIKHDTDTNESGDGDGEEEIHPADEVEIQVECAGPHHECGPVTNPAPDDDNAAPPPEHLSALIGTLHGPADLGRNHDTYMTNPATTTTAESIPNASTSEQSPAID